MISLEQINLLGQKIESAVAKIAQLQSENDALRKRCDELTNALSAKSEQLSMYEQQEGQLESGILAALEHLSVLDFEPVQTNTSLSEQNNQTFEQNQAYNENQTWTNDQSQVWTENTEVVQAWEQNQYQNQEQPNGYNIF